MIEALYIHIPFCKRKCDYCSFFSCDLVRLRWLQGAASSEKKTLGANDFIRSYIDFLAQQLEELRASGVLDQIKTVYVGGGTPSLLKNDDLQRLFKPLFDLHFNEVTFEANPESLTFENLSVLKDIGITRISLGIQSMRDKELESVNRLSSALKNEEALNNLDGTDFEISADVIVGLPFQKEESLEKTLVEILQRRVNHLSVYPLSIEKGTPLARNIYEGTIPAVNEDAQADLMEFADAFLSKAGFNHYEISNYAKPGHESRHNMAYWEGKEYLGLGYAAASMLQKETYEKVAPFYPHLRPASRERGSASAVPSYIWGDAARIRFRWKPVPLEKIFSESKEETSHNLTFPALIQKFKDSLHPEDFEILNKKQAAAEELMLAARMKNGLTNERIRVTSEFLCEDKIHETLGKLCEEGFLRETLAGYVRTNRGWMVGNHLFGELWNLAGDTDVFYL